MPYMRTTGIGTFPEFETRRSLQTGSNEAKGDAQQQVDGERLRPDLLPLGTPRARAVVFGN